MLKKTLHLNRVQIDQKLTFNVFHLLNQGRISKIEKISDGTDPPQKRSFFGGSRALDEKDFGYVSGRIRNQFFPRRLLFAILISGGHTENYSTLK